MRVRLQKNNVLVLPKYEKDVTSIIVYDDNENPMFVASATVAGGHQFSYVGMPDFDRIFEEITGKKPNKVTLTEYSSKNEQS